MTEPAHLGKLIAVHGVAPAHLQRAVFIAVLSFMFFIAMIFAFYILQNILYFLLSTAFLIVYLITMFAIIRQRRSAVEVFENGVKYRKQAARWSEIEAIKADGTIEISGNESIVIPSSMSDFSGLMAFLKGRMD